MKFNSATLKIILRETKFLTDVRPTGSCQQAHEEQELHVGRRWCTQWCCPRGRPSILFLSSAFPPSRWTSSLTDGREGKKTQEVRNSFTEISRSVRGLERVSSQFPSM
ncbi:hypothetical protein CDAR_615841 [Caerostris darwini]|uniref:Uncharacterized protein n=1 Tax=Caerostris darwini TaxID=1538125 RepID=A0AAV4RXL3_9ARAC|nr:hypothetical protein CDAR_615841 [Caerostris darwini]